jgi:microcin C transport system permease protein
MRDYFIRRLLLIIPTLIGATLVVFFITRITPGGPLEAAIQQAKSMNAQRSLKNAGGSMSEEQKDELAAFYGFDKSFFPAYLTWLGILPRETQKQFVKFEENETTSKVTLKTLLPRAEWTDKNAYRIAEATVAKDGKVTAADPATLKGWEWRNEPDKKRVVIYRPAFSGLLQGDFGISTRYNDPVLQMIWERLPVSLFYGLATFILTYIVCIPLGILKAIKHRTLIDNVTSILIFVGYAIPGFVLGSLLVVYLAARFGWFPSGGFMSDNFDSLSAPGKAWDLLYHAMLPLVCYMIGGFAFLTMLMKNSLMDNLAADYVRTAIAKGASHRRAVLHHALRNSLIPVATTLGGITLIFVGGSILIEMIFDINGFGMLSYQSIVDRDYPVVMAILVIDVVLLMLGNIISDFLVAATDPRIRFN